MATTSEEENQGPSNGSIDDLKHLERTLRSVAAHMSSQAKYEDAVIFMGRTRSGKSSLINYTIGNKLLGAKISACSPVVLIKADNSSGPKIGIGFTSETKIPNRWDSQKLPNLGIWDVPGFGDNRGARQVIANAFYIYELFKSVKSAKIILVCDINDITNDSISPFLSLLNSVENIFNEKLRECCSGIGIIFSKVPNALHGNVVDKNFINELLKQLLSSKAIAVSETAQELVRYLIKNNQHIGIFKRATVGDISDDIIDAEIFETIKETNAIPEQILKQVSPSISHSSKVFLFNVREKLSCMQVFVELQNLLGSIFEETLFDFKTRKDEELSYDNLIQWTQDLSVTADRISQVLDSKIGFAPKIFDLRVIDSRIENLIRENNLHQKAKLMEFVDHLLNLKESNQFDITLQSILVTAKVKVEELLIWVKLQLKEINIKEAEAQRSKAKEEYENHIEELTTEMKNIKEHNEKIKNGIFAYAGHIVDCVLESSGISKYIEDIKNLWRRFKV